MSTLFTVVGGQFGSEAKGHVAAQLASREIESGNQVIAVRVAGPNAGHTAYDSEGRSFALRTIPVMAVVDPNVQLVIAAGSEIDMPVLRDEVELLESNGHKVWHRLFIDGQATMLEQKHHDAETAATMHERLGSTGKGVGAARSDRLLRKATLWQDSIGNGEFKTRDTSAMLSEWLHSTATTVIVEGTQGYGLGLHAGHYPFCTSSDCRSVDFLAMAGIDPRHAGIDDYRAWVVCRTHPIRVAGNSGHLHEETTWEQLAFESNGHIQPERTTVTKKIRRVGRWDPKLARAAVRANGESANARIALTFADYIDPAVSGVTDPGQLTTKVWDFIYKVERDALASVKLVTTGPKTAVWL